MLAGLTKGPNSSIPIGILGARRNGSLMFSAACRRTRRSRGAASRPRTASAAGNGGLRTARRDIGFHFVDQVAREVKSLAGIQVITANSYTVRSTINPQLQRAVETTLQEGLSRYERSAGRVQFVSPEAKLGKAVERAEAEQKAGDKRPA